MDIIKVENLTKEFNSFKAVDNISFDIKEGEIFGLLGPNGAGKTTTIRILTGILKPTKGSVKIDKYDIQNKPLDAKQLMGIVPETADAYPDLSAYKNLFFIGELYGLQRGNIVKKANKLLELFELKEKIHNKVKTFSKGMRQRLVLAMALMNESKILILDEPTSGLDVKSARLIKTLIKKFNQESKTILLTTHNIEDANQLCDRVAIMNYGKIVAIDSPEKLKDVIQSLSSVEVSFEKPTDIKDFKFVDITKTVKEGDKIKFYTKNPEGVLFSLVDYAKSSGNKIISLNTLKPTLEDVFVKLTENKNDNS
ncbi:ATP-binding protein [candidate division WWE3 bacterium RIFOXYC1_FULL_42_17]|nr:MAG: ATP-binding protein [candidate division WWE3 bacterium RIFOXYB1_FULL_42_27]OGC71948.1 MAG: ATP-binding protein [candidate division WWE3 bacterium RIFOXYD1_FULL_42_24]OGC74649.1 MAG: ATP-binding protein [candidate division WWE3 bacterium RIFOXYC1_FULL_42_17]